MSDGPTIGRGVAETAKPLRLRDALRKARVEQPSAPAWWSTCTTPKSPGSKCSNEALEPVFDELPAEVDLFDRGISRGDTPRLWIDPIAHVAMGRDKRIYRFCRTAATAARCWPRPATWSRWSMR